MEEIENAFGMSVEISNNPVYINAIKKYSEFLKCDYEDIELRIDNLATTIGIYAGDINRDKIKLFSKSFILGFPDGGESTMKYVNSNINVDKQKISEYDIMMKRLKDIFKNDNSIFSNGLIRELKNMYGNDNSLPESYIVKIAYALEIISSYLINNCNYSNEEVSKFISKEIRFIGEEYNKTKEFKLSKSAHELLKKIIQMVPDLAQELSDVLKGIVEQYNNADINHDELINVVSNVNIHEKKNRNTR